MTPTRQGSLRLFRFAGITVYLHWSWFLVAAYEISGGFSRFSSPAWNALEYGALFAVVLLHEFGHALACRSVGGRADQIVLWPLGGVAYVSPPQRPGAQLWSIAAGPLVNVVLLFSLFGLELAGALSGWLQAVPDAAKFFNFLIGVNLVLLGLNLLPIFPLDGGQILRSLLWFVLGRARSLMVASVLGFVSAALLLGAVGLSLFGGIDVFWVFFGKHLLGQSIWPAILLVFILLNCWMGFQQARALARAEEGPRHAGFACPACHTAPPAGLFWVCGRCQTRFDTFATRAVCPRCGTQFPITHCAQCGAAHPFEQWMVAPASPSPPPLLRPDLQG